ncbi:hypothetical protein [Streptomyces sp. NPDC055287]
MSPAAYEARLHRIGRWWAVDIPQAAVHTQCRTLGEAEDMARDAIAEACGIRPDTVAVTLVVPEFAPLLRGVREARTHRAAADAAEQQALADAARTLIEDHHVSQSDAGRLLGLSHQEVSQLPPARRSSGSRPWQLGPPPPPGAPAAAMRNTNRDSGTDRDSRTDRDSGTSRPRPPRQAASSRPAWALTEDDA